MFDNIPSYAVEPLDSYKDYWSEAMRLLDMSMNAIKDTIPIPRLLEALGVGSQRKLRGNEKSLELLEQEQRSVERAKETAALAQKEVDTGFRLLHAHTLVGLWGALEAAVEDLVVGILLNEPAALESDSLRKTRIPLADFHLMDAQHRIRWLVNDFGRTRGMGQRQGVNAFEGSLEMVGLTGSVEDTVKTLMWEANHVRNVIVHRRAKADRELVRSCPQMGLNIGDQVIVSPDKLWAYATAFKEYADAISMRLKARYITNKGQ